MVQPAQRREWGGTRGSAVSIALPSSCAQCRHRRLLLASSSTRRRHRPLRRRPECSHLPCHHLCRHLHRHVHHLRHHIHHHLRPGPRARRSHPLCPMRCLSRPPLHCERRAVLRVRHSSGCPAAMALKLHQRMGSMGESRAAGGRAHQVKFCQVTSSRVRSSRVQSSRVTRQITSNQGVRARGGQNAISGGRAQSMVVVSG